MQYWREVLGLIFCSFLVDDHNACEHVVPEQPRFCLLLIFFCIALLYLHFKQNLMVACYKMVHNDSRADYTNQKKQLAKRLAKNWSNALIILLDLIHDALIIWTEHSPIVARQASEPRR